MSWQEWGPTKSMAQLRAESLAILADPPPELRDARPVVAEDRQQVTTPVGLAFFAAVASFAGRSGGSRMSKAKGLLRHHCLLDLKVKVATAEDPQGGCDGRVHGGDTYATAFRLHPPPPSWWAGVVAEVRPKLGPADAARLARGGVPGAMLPWLTDTTGPLMPEARESPTSCDCLDAEWACKHVLCTALGLGVLLDREPLLLLRLHGLDPGELTPDLADVLPAPGEAPPDALDAATVERLFGAR